MSEEQKATIRHIINNKQVVLASIVISLAALFIFSLEEQSQAQTVAQGTQDEYLDSNQERLARPEDADIRGVTELDPTFFDVAAQRALCSNSRTLSASNESVELSKRRILAPILTYHYVEAPGSSTLPWLYTTPETFEAQLKTLVGGCYHSLFVSEVYDAIASGRALPDKPITLTFDDGYDDMYYGAYPLLKKYGMKGTMYIIVNALDKPGYLTRDQVKEMSDSGQVEIASHTLNHANLNKSTWAVARYEITGSKAALEEIIGKPVTDLAYPYGYFTARDEAICREAGYQTCASTYPGQIQTFAKRFSLYRLRPGYRTGAALTNWLEAPGPKN